MDYRSDRSGKGASRLLPISLLLLLTGLFLSLGLWQLQRADEKQALLTRLQHNTTEPAKSLRHFDRELDYRFKRVLLEGYWIDDKPWLIEKRTSESFRYRLILPFQLRDTEQVVLVELGQVQKSKLPVNPLMPNRGTEVFTRIEAIAITPIEPWLQLEPPAPNNRVQPYLSMQRMEIEIGRPLVPYLLLQQGENPFQLTRVYPEPKDDVGMHIGYATQWFFFSLFAFLTAGSIVLRKTRSTPNDWTNNYHGESLLSHKLSREP